MAKIIHEQGITLEKEEREALKKRAVSQQEKVYNYFLTTDGIYTAEHISEFIMPEAPLTSARRCLSNLIYEKKIEKCGTTMGKFGIRICKYKLKKQQHEKD